MIETTKRDSERAQPVSSPARSRPSSLSVLAQDGMGARRCQINENTNKENSFCTR